MYAKKIYYNLQFYTQKITTSCKANVKKHFLTNYVIKYFHYKNFRNFYIVTKKIQLIEKKFILWNIYKDR